MKVQCERCGAAYSVADDKVAGRKLRQRCRKCGDPIVIDGTAVDGAAVGPEPEALAVSVPADSDAVWHIAVGDTTQGPYTLDELAQYYADGHIVLDTLVCRDGWADWKQAADVAELVSASRAPEEARPQSGVLMPQRPSLEQPVAMGSDPFGEPAASPRVSVEDMLTPGMQHDGTVQFSMDQIRALSGVSMTSIAPVAPSKSGYASGGDSGLIDMRALADAEAQAAAAAALNPQGSSNGYRPLTPSQIAPYGAISPLALTASDRPRSGIDTRTKVWASVAVFALVLFGVVGALFAVRRNGPDASVAVADPAAAHVAGAATAIAQPPQPAPVADKPAQPAVKPQPALVAAEEVAAADKVPAKTTRGSKKASVSAGEDKHASKHAAAKDDEDSPKAAASSKSDPMSVDDILVAKAPTKKGGSSSIDDMMLGALNGKKAAPKEEAEPKESTLPASPSREQMMSALSQAKTKAAKCKGPGVATAEITIAGKNGRATGVSVTGVEGAAKSCVEKAVKSTSFPKFQKDTFEVKFPFKLGA